MLSVVKFIAVALQIPVVAKVAVSFIGISVNDFDIKTTPLCLYIVQYSIDTPNLLQL